MRIILFDYKQKVYKVDNSAGQGMLSFDVGNADNLILGTEATTEYQNDYLSAYNLSTSKLTRMGSMPYGVEVISPI